MTKATLHYKDYTPLSVNGKRDPARRYINQTGHTISVRAFQEGAHAQAGTQRKLSDTEKMSRFYRVVARLGGGESLKSASKTEGLSPETVRKINEQKTPSREYNGKTIEGAARRVYSPKYSLTTGRRMRGFTINAPNEAPLLTLNKDGSSAIITLQVDRININLLGSYWHYAGLILSPTATDRQIQLGMEQLQRFAGKVVYDLDGNAYPLITDGNALLLAIGALPDGDYEDIWSRFNSEKKVA